MKWGALVILSNPPVKTKSLCPNFILLEPIEQVFIPEAQTLLRSQVGTDLSTPPPRLDCLAGFCPKPVLNTFPKITSDIFLESTLVSSNTPLIAKL